MNENSLQEMALRETPLNSAITDLITSFCFINIGTIYKIHNDNFVDAKFYYGNGTLPDVTNIRLLQLGTTKCKIFIKPQIGDNILLLCPRDFIKEIEFNHERSFSDIMYNYFANCNMCGILIKDESDDNVLTSININEDGDVDFSTQGLISASQIDDQGEEKASVKVDKDGNIAIKSDNGKVNLDGDKWGGLCKTQELKTQLDKATARIDQIITAIKLGSNAAVPQDGGKVAFETVSNALPTDDAKEDYSNIESQNVFHGDNSSS